MRVEVPKSDRTKTRMERYREKMESGQSMRIPFQIVCVNFGKENNIAHCYRTAACFGAEVLHLIGNYDDSNSTLRAISGTTNKLTETIIHKSPSDFIRWCRENNVKIACLELPEDQFIKTYKLHEYKFDFSDNQKWAIIGGHETFGCSMELLKAGDVLHIETLGPAYCLNVSQAVNIAAYEFSRQYSNFLSKNRFQ